MLLGLYEIIVGNELHPGYHNPHARGLAALLGIRSSSVGLIEAVHRSHPLLLRIGAKKHKETIFSTPASKKDSRSLDDLLLSLSSLVNRANALFQESSKDFSDTLNQLHNEAQELDRAFPMWKETRETSFHPSTIFYMEDNYDPSECPVGFWPGEVDTYFDLYSSAVWNIYRAARLFLVDLILKLSSALNDERSLDTETETANCLVDASHLDIVNFQIKRYLNRCLWWISKNMGIGQAAIFAQVCINPFTRTLRKMPHLLIHCIGV
ncbi:hypothetical protein TSTA_061610 [Talaromyces stipitatus ATCC 10500]|uniref:Uncharacterized protein n=1 Tax=Talaromyces stipitatus (strain ATCC 10500 / CBS 375.48 / QM 6759 / NRRL 1006) TaxID=441959 RepID=B8LX23_TALSN|nr:uncharacterized protein TSTA_061610 [Talaromyces stipitatus ATCC 10500]EED22673.1 hypothetical protein TSTA_061610 [Talaromyces stipitatus ATCC 10500]